MNSLELKLPPPVVALVTAFLMWLAARLVPALALPYAVGKSAVLAPVLIGIGISLSGIVAFRRAKTTASPLRLSAASSLVTGGVYRFTRNPMYLGLLLVLLGWALFLRNGAAFVLLPCFMLYLNRFQIAPEERALASRFGEAFDAYKNRTRRWI